MGISALFPGSDPATHEVYRRKQKQAVFFFTLPLVLPHAELVMPEDAIFEHFKGKYPENPYKGGFRSDVQERRLCIAGLSEGCLCGNGLHGWDKYVGGIVEEWKRQGIYDSRADRFTSDNGPHTKGSNPIISTVTEYRGYNTDLYEGGIRRRLFPEGTRTCGYGESFRLRLLGLSSRLPGLLGRELGEERRHKRTVLMLTGKKGQRNTISFYFRISRVERLAKRGYSGIRKLLHLNNTKKHGI